MRSVLAMVALVAFVQTAAAAQTAGSALTGKMAGTSYLMGAAWTCVTNLPAMMGRPARTETTTVTFDVAPGNVMHVHVAGGEYLGDSYFGYAAQTNSYWSSGSDNMGEASSEQSADGRAYKGVAAFGGVTGTVTDTYAHTGTNHATVHSVTTIGSQTITTDATCTR